MFHPCNIFVADGCSCDGFLAGRPSVCEDPTTRRRSAAPSGTLRSPMSPHRRPAPADPRVRALVAQAANRGRSANLSRRSFLVGGARHRRCGAPCSPRAAPGLAVGDRLGRGRTCPTATSWSAGPTGRCTSTRTTTGPATRRSRRSRSRSGLDGRPTPRTSTTTTRSTARSPGQLANGQDIGYDIVTLTDWMAARMIRLGYTQALDKAQHARTRRTSCRASRTSTSTRAARTR